MKVDLGQKKGKIVVEFASMEDLERILGTLAPGEGRVLQKSLLDDDSEDDGGLSRRPAVARLAGRAVSGVYRNTARPLLSGGIDGIASWIRCVRVWRIHLAGTS